MDEVYNYKLFWGSCLHAMVWDYGHCIWRGGYKIYIRRRYFRTAAERPSQQCLCGTSDSVPSFVLS